MLILTRKQGETFVIGENIEITVVEVSGDKAKIAINAPKEVKILRKELIEAEKLNQEAAAGSVNVAALKGIMKKSTK